MTAGRLGGIARHDRPRGSIETLLQIGVSRAEGVQGDARGTIRPGSPGSRQVTMMEAGSWDSAMRDLGVFPGTELPWHVRRANLLVEGLRLPRAAGAIIAIGASLRILITGECDPCSRMDRILPGLQAALRPDWRGGVTGRVLSDGAIAVGDEVRIET